MRTACRHEWQQFQGLSGLGQETTRGTLVPIIPSSALQIRPNWSLFRLYTTISVRYQSSEREIVHFLLECELGCSSVMAVMRPRSRVRERPGPGAEAPMPHSPVSNQKT